MKDAECHTAYLGLESTSIRLKRLLNNFFYESNSLIKDGISSIRRAGLRAYGSFVIGLPTETVDEIHDTIKFSLALKLSGVSHFIYSPFPGTKLREFAFNTGE